MGKSTEKDIILLCKRRYDSSKYHTLLDAFEAYYHKHYECGDIQMDYKLAVNLFLKPTVEFLLSENRIKSFVNNGLFEECFCEKRPMQEGKCTEFYEILYHRLTKWICSQKVREKRRDTGEYEWIIDFLDYVDDENII